MTTAPLPATPGAPTPPPVRVQDIADHLSGVVYRSHVDAQGRRRFVYVSEGVRELLGLSPEQVLADGDAVVRLCHPEDRARMAAEATRAGVTGMTVTYEHRLLLPDGQIKWVLVRATPLPASAGTEFVGVVLDITAQKRAEARLAESNERWKLALESTGDGLWDWNLVTGEEVYSPRFLEMYGYSAEELARNPAVLDSLTHPDDRAAMDEARRAHFAGHTPSYVNEHRVRCRDGQWKWVLSRGLVIERDASGRPLRMIGTHTDISARRQAEALRLERDRAETADRAKTELLSRVSHELRTPLNAVLGFAQLLQRETDLPAHQRAWLGHVLDAGRHLLHLVNDVLDLTGAQSGQLSMHLVDQALGEALEEAWTLTMAGHALGSQGLVLRRDWGDAATETVRADRRRLVQIVVNLLSNAIKYNRPGGAVSLGARREGPWVRIDVRDEGAGLTPEQLGRLFSPFERVGAERTAVEGSGLGLALSQQLALAMGGQLIASSTPGQGSVFTLSLPAGDADAPRA